VLDLEALAKESRAERVAVLDSWLAGLLADAVAGTPPPKQRRGAVPPRTGTDGLALVAVGSLGRREPPPHGDVDLVLSHRAASLGALTLAEFAAQVQLQRTKLRA